MLKLREEQWLRIREHFPEENVPDTRPGRKSIPTRRVMEAVLWSLNTGAQWHMLPQGYPNYKTVHRRFPTASASATPDPVERLVEDPEAARRLGAAASASACQVSP